MKKSIWGVAFAVAATIALATACTKETPTPENDGFLREFSATIADYGTKAQVNIATGKVAFEDGDEVAVSNGMSVSTYVYSSATGKFTAQSDPLPALGKYWAYYPASGYAGAGDGGAMKVNLPAMQTYDAAAVLQAPMGAVANGTSFAFKNLCAIIACSLTGDEVPTGIEFSAERGVCGEAVFSSEASLAMAEGQPKAIKMEIPSSFASGNPVCLVIPAGLYSGGFHLTCTYASGPAWYKSVSKDIAIEAGYIQAPELFEVTDFSGGKGTEASPYKIATKQDLLDLSDYIASSDAARKAFRTAYYRQVADIEFDGATLPSIGNGGDENNGYFEGSYDGGGFKISHVVISNPETGKSAGFFGNLGGNAHIDGLKLENPVLNAVSAGSGIIVGCVQASSHVIVENCTVTGAEFTGADENNGGICGRLMSGTIKNCSYQGPVTSTTNAKHQCAGIVGYVSAAGCIVADCSFDGTVTAACGNVGGIVGRLNGGASVTNCFVSAVSTIIGGSIENNGINVGGIAGYIDASGSGGKVEDCIVEGTVVAHYYDIGGIVGRDQNVPIRGCAFKGKVTSDWDESGASGDKFGRVGGISGHIHGNAFVENCHVSGIIGESDKQVSFTGGVVGWLEQGSVSGCKNDAPLAVQGKANVGGIVGRVKSGLVKNCTLSGITVTGGGNNVGGCVGSMVAGVSLSACSVENSTLSGNMAVGGICGLFDTGGYISGSTVSGSSITAATKLAGGILGNMSGATAAISSRVDRCTITGGTGLAVRVNTGNAGGILGGCNTYGIVNLCSASIDVIHDGNDDSGCIGGIVGWTSTQNIVIANCVYYGGELHCDTATGASVGGICGQFNANNGTIGKSTIVNCCSFPAKVSSKKGNIGGIAGLANTVTIRNCYCPTPGENFLVNGATSNRSRGSIYGMLSGVNTSDPCSGVLKDVYWLDGFKAGAYSGSYTFDKSEQALTDGQMRGTGAVSRPSTGVVYGGFLEALNAAVDGYNAAPVFDVRAQVWVMGTNGYPVPAGTVLAGESSGAAQKRVSLLGDSITTYQGYTPYPGNYQYPKSSYTDFTSVTQTYWYQLIYGKMDNAVLEVNSSYTGTCVQNTTTQGHPGYGFLQRYVDLGDPDIILINGGTNDAWSFKLPVGTLDFSLATEALDTYQFAQAYDKLIRLMKACYPKAKIGCIIGDNVMDQANTAYAQVIRDVCTHYNLPYAEVVFADRAASTYDSVHPNPAGMTEMANQIYTQLQEIL